MPKAITIVKKTAKYLGLLLLALLVVVFAAIPLALWETPDDLVAADNAQALAIDNVHLVTMAGEEFLSDRQLLLRDGRIQAIRASGSEVGDEYTLIDGKGGFVLPGLFDMHTHVMDRKYLALHLAYGVTSVRNMGGYPMHLRWKRELSNGEWLGSNLFTAAPTLNGKRNSNPFAHKVVEKPGEARELVRRYHAAGYDFIKVYTRLSVDVFDAIVDEADKLSFAVAGHVPYAVVAEDYRRAAAMVTLEHAEEIYQGPMSYEYDDEALSAIALQLRDMGATLTPTLLIFDHLTQIALGKQQFVDGLPLEYLNPFMRFVESKGSVARWLNAGDKLRDSLAIRNAYFQRITRVLHDTGVDLLVGSDNGVLYAVPGVSTHDEIELLAQAGLAPQDILRMATVNAARVLAVDDRLGTIEVGKTADLILAQRDPRIDLATLRTPQAVIKDGQWLDRPTLEFLRASATNPSNSYLTFGRLLEFVICK